MGNWEFGFLPSFYKTTEVGTTETMMWHKEERILHPLITHNAAASANSPQKGGC